MELIKVYPIDPKFAQVLGVFSPDRGISYVYPSAYFQQHPRKPPLTVIKEDAAHCYHRLDLMIREQKWDDLIATSFMAAVIHESPDQFSQVLPRQWSSFQQIIGEASTTVTPLSIYELRAAKDVPAIEDPINGGDAALRMSIFYALLLLYKNTISKSFKKHGGASAQSLINYFHSTNLRVQETQLSRVSNYADEYNMTSGYKKIICAIDMFFNRFPNAGYASMRVATRSSRYKGCAAITSLEQVASVAKLATSDLLQFVFTKPVTKDVARITKEGEEVENPFGYFPYHVEMEFTRKSAYSMSTNPTFCFWLNVVGSVMGITRHLNAKMLIPVLQETTFKTAAAVGLHLEESADIPERFLKTEAVSTNLRQNRKRVREEETAGVGSTLEATVYPRIQSDLLDARVNGVLTSIRTNEGLSREQEDILRTKALRCHNYPKGTVGAYFYQNYAGQ